MAHLPGRVAYLTAAGNHSDSRRSVAEHAESGNALANHEPGPARDLPQLLARRRLSTKVGVSDTNPGLSGTVRVGVAGWTLPKEHGDRFPEEGTHLERYAARFPAVEISSSLLYKPHRPTSYARWAASVRAAFRFCVKAPKLATPDRRLVGVGDVLDSFLAEATQLGDRLRPLLVQLPPSLSFSA